MKYGRGSRLTALAHTSYFDTTAFAPQRQQLVSNAITVSPTEVFSHLERRQTTYMPQPKRVGVLIIVGGEHVLLEYLDYGEGLPSWAKPVLNSLSERWGVGYAWDSYHAQPTDIRHAVKLLNYLSNLLKCSAPPPIITPLADGGVQAEWHVDNKDFEIVVPAHELSRYYFYNAATTHEEEGPLEANRQHVQEIIETL
jgi:hypothetical protein